MDPDYMSQLYDQVDINSVFGGSRTIVSSPYGDRPSLGDWHEGIDVVHLGRGGTQWGDLITYGKDLVVESIGRQAGYGNTFSASFKSSLMDIEGNAQLFFGHARAAQGLKVGDVVRAGERLGTLSNPGGLKPHLHLELRINFSTGPVKVNPMMLFK